MENKFVNGLFINNPSENAKDFVIAKVSVSADTFIPFLKDNTDGKGYMKFDILKSKEGKLYAKLDNWKPKTEDRGQFPVGNSDDVYEASKREFDATEVPF